MKLISLCVIFPHNIDWKSKIFMSSDALHCFWKKSLFNTQKLRLELDTVLLGAVEVSAGVKKETPLPPQGINNVHSYRGDRWETALPLPHKPYLLLQLFNFATPTPPFLLFGVHAWRSAPCFLSLPLRYMHLKRLHILRKQSLGCRKFKLGLLKQ